MQAEIIKDPSKYVELDPDMAQSLMDMRQAVRFRTTESQHWSMHSS